MSSWILGISASHNGSYCLLEDGEIRVAIQEERLVGLKRARVHGGRRGLGLRYCLDTAGIRASDLAMVVLSCQRSSRSEENDIWLHPDLRGLADVPRRTVSHHLAHAASAVATSGYESAAVLVVDGLGSPVEDLSGAARSVVVDLRDNAWEHMSLFSARRNTITPRETHVADQWVEKRPGEMWRFFSLGGMFSAVAQQIFGDADVAGKVMGLAPYGEPCIPVEELLQLDGHRIRFPNLVQRRFQDQARWPAHERTYQDLAASAQRALEVALLHMATRLHEMTNETSLCFAGGVALNSVANQRICLETGFERVYIVPAAEDSGVAVGAAYLGHWELGGSSPRRQIRTDAHGRTATAREVEEAIRVVPDIDARKPGDLLGEVVDRLRQGQIGGWLQGGAELGPRALGQRSIVCSPCGPDAKEALNARVKFREHFRPFAPSVLADHAASWFDFGPSSPDSPFMLRVVPFRKEVRERIPAVVHVDGTGRLQTLTAGDNGRFYDLVARFHAESGVPMLLNTSMNVRGEPIVETPVDALWCLLGTGLDFCVVHDWLVTKRQGFRTILDYVPAVVAEEYTLRMGVADHSLQTAIQREDAVTVRTSTPWGKVDVVLPVRLLPLLSSVDGRRDGHALQGSLAGNPPAAGVVRDLLLLRRMHIIELRPAPALESHHVTRD
jgi:carbamoyltransferase